MKLIALVLGAIVTGQARQIQVTRPNLDAKLRLHLRVAQVTSDLGKGLAQLLAALGLDVLQQVVNCFQILRRDADFRPLRRLSGRLRPADEPLHDRLITLQCLRCAPEQSWIEDQQLYDFAREAVVSLGVLLSAWRPRQHLVAELP